jgi:hypothetical protein
MSALTLYERIRLLTDNFHELYIVSQEQSAEHFAILADVRELERNDARYRYLRQRDLDAIVEGGVFAGLVPDNMVINGDDLDDAIDAAIAKCAATKEST